LCLLLTALGIAAFWPARSFDFVVVDDYFYVYGNPYLTSGITPAGVRWAFTADLFAPTRYADYWQPVTILSRLADVQCFGLNPAGHHLSNVLIHAAASILAFLVIVRIGGSPLPGFVAAALFAVHPLKVESVAWVTERKDVLSGFFCFLTVLAYLWYTSKPAIGRFVAVVTSFALGLMSKPVLVVLPAALLLLDVSPLRRFQDRSSVGRECPAWRGSWKIVLFEKFILLIFSVASFLITFSSHSPDPQRPLWLDSLSMLTSRLGWYTSIFLYPADLTIIYPLRHHLLPVWGMGLTLAMCSALTWLVFRRRIKNPLLFFGWIWFLIFLLPALAQIVPASRFTYLPTFGLSIFAVFGVREILKICPGRTYVGPALSLLAVFACFFLSQKELVHWKDSEALFRRNLAIVGPNSVAYGNIGGSMMRQGRYEDAIPYLLDSLRLNPGREASHLNLALARSLRGETDSAIFHFQRAIQIDPLNDVSHHNLAIALKRKGLTHEAAEHFRQALEITPANAAAHNNFGILLLEIGKKDEALGHFREVLRLNAEFDGLHYRIANILADHGDISQAIHHYRAAMTDRLGGIQAANNLAWILATHPDPAVRNGPESVRIAENSIRGILNPPPELLDTLAAAYAAADHYAAAERVASRALAMVRDSRNDALVRGIEMRLNLYRSKNPYLSADFTP